MQTVTLNGFYHRNQECIGISFINNAELNYIIKQIPEHRISGQQKALAVVQY